MDMENEIDEFTDEVCRNECPLYRNGECKGLYDAYECLEHDYGDLS